jgi:acetyltransferase-like isoleucine patch superfamily enzyme
MLTQTHLHRAVISPIHFRPHPQLVAEADRRTFRTSSVGLQAFCICIAIIGSILSIVWTSKRVFVGTNSILLKGATIGDNSVIGGSVATGHIPKTVIAVGNPCCVLRALTSEELRH